MARLGTARLGTSTLAGGTYTPIRLQVGGGSASITVVQKYASVTMKVGG